MTLDVVALSSSGPKLSRRKRTLFSLPGLIEGIDLPSASSS